MFRFFLFAAVIMLLSPGWLRAQQNPVNLLPAGEFWRFNDGGVYPGYQWISADYNDSAWPTGKAPLGYGDNNITTRLSFGSDTWKKYIAYYFRKTIQIDNLSQYQVMLIRLRRDDGAIVYINGREAFRTNMMPGVLSPVTHSIDIISGTSETQFYEFPVSAGLFREGLNVIAVQVHQRDGTSSDIVMDFELVGYPDARLLTLDSPGDAWYSDFPSAFGTARVLNRPLLYYFHSNEVNACLRLNQSTFGTPGLHSEMSSSLVRFQVNVDNLSDKSILQQYQIVKVPATIIYSPTHAEPLRVDGFFDPIAFRSRIRGVLRGGD